jgi:hypothetical protein
MDRFAVLGTFTDPSPQAPVHLSSQSTSESWGVHLPRPSIFWSARRLRFRSGVAANDALAFNMRVWHRRFVSQVCKLQMPRLGSSSAGRSGKGGGAPSAEAAQPTKLGECLKGSGGSVARWQDGLVMWKW